MPRIARLGLFGGLALVVSAGTASAQWLPTPGWLPAPGNRSTAPYNPFSPLTGYRFQPYYNVQVNSIYGRFTVGSAIPWYNPRANYNYVLKPWSERPSNNNSTPWGSLGGPVTSGYMSGGIRNNVVAGAQEDYERAQREATAERNRAAGRDAFRADVDYEQGAKGLPAAVGKDAPEALAKALAAANPDEILSGEGLNQILKAIVAAEAKGAKGPSAYLPPKTLDDVRFGGSPAGDAVNLIRQAGKLPFPPAFADARLTDLRDQLDKDFTAAATPLADGKPADPMKLVKLGVTLQRAQEAATAVIRDLPFDEAVASRRFLNRFESALPALKAAGAATLVVPAWATEGASVADLVRHMTKQKLQFGAAPKGGDASYVDLHRGLATYLFVLTQPPPKK